MTLTPEQIAAIHKILDQNIRIIETNMAILDVISPLPEIIEVMGPEGETKH